MAIKIVINPDIEVSQNLGHYLFIDLKNNFLVIFCYCLISCETSLRRRIAGNLAPCCARRSGRVQSYTPLASRLQNTTLPHTASAGNTPENLPAAAGEPPRRLCFALDGCSRFSGDLAQRHSVRLMPYSCLECGSCLILPKISRRRRESRLAARASHSTVAVDFPETSLCGIPCGLCRTHALSVVVV